MWRTACPNSSIFFENLTLEQALFLSPDLSNDLCEQLALWSDVVGHMSNDIRAMGTSPSRVFSDGAGVMIARLRQIVVQSDEARAVISEIRAALTGEG